jgi:predicted DNA-binding transcriptional regulator AlpA
MTSRLLSLYEVRSALGGISAPTLWRMFRRGDLAFYRIGNRKMVSQDDLSAYLDARRCGGR